MKRQLLSLVIMAAILPVPAMANHLFHTGIPHETRGSCEAEVGRLLVDDREMLLANFPQFFSSTGEVASFLTRAFPCELNTEDQKWYIIDKRLEVLSSGWFQRRL